MLDYPAAHSMDTDWFAIDADGNVGIFVSSEDGAVPHQIRSSIDLEDFISQLPKNNRGISVFSADGSSIIKDAGMNLLLEDLQVSEQVAEKQILFEPSWEGIMYDLILRLQSENVIDDLLPNVWGQFSGSEVVIYVDRCTTKKMRQLIEAGKILGGRPDVCPFTNAHFFGLFPFRHDFGAPAPYKLMNSPDQALKISTLPSELQDSIKQMLFNQVKFPEVTEIQPIEHVECRTWRSDNWWLDTKDRELNKTGGDIMVGISRLRYSIHATLLT